MRLDMFPAREAFTETLQTATVIPVGMKILADAETPVSVLSRFANENANVFLFESAEGGERWGRYSFIGISARATIRIYREEVVCRQGITETRIPHRGDPLAVLRDRMRPYTLAPMPGLPRFCGGLVGYFTYEMIHFFEPRVPNTLPQERPMAELFIPDTLLIFDNAEHTLTVVALAFREDDADPDALYTAAVRRVHEVLDVLALPADVTMRLHKTPIRMPQPAHPPERFQEQVEIVKRHIREGDIIQCVISQRFVGPAPDDVVSLYRAQRYVNPSPYLFFLKSAECTLIGSSPETMIRLDNRTACLRPIAGTRPRGATEQEDRKYADALLQDEKERAEHLMLVDLGRHELGRVARTGTVQVTDLMVIERYSHVMHLVSNITADLEPACDAFDLLRSSFPAGTLCGAPKIRAMEIITDLEEEPRGPYGGAVGYISFDGNMDFAICIRTAVVEHGRLTVRAGAGIVADSDPETEHRETVNKAGAMARAIELLKRVQENELSPARPVKP
ncbi:MAG TPA: anthranilate synthase component I family protein [Kiritimatiellia bacterium]|nr:anthranilate synthase component I family protein [Kiritimatiellia bacterium]HOM58554.1 anthranilate synthase component I family protein [Kiritimatiellia bacterium]HOR97635.1 anthranilate synthase component I family protein [Kiritimatiellia bacterium]HPK36943.1 anthranilate synthase component I family protein [Kiritimatiellia bacterium]HPW75314.1 anthranilate synthase component I family protein [Kiritimatiellia bacterium]